MPGVLCCVLGTHMRTTTAALLCCTQAGLALEPSKHQQGLHAMHPLLIRIPLNS